MNLVLPVLSLLLWQTSATQGIESTWPADFSAAFSAGGFHQAQSYDGWQAGGGVGANWYLRRPLVDDGSPLSIQSFLQRLDRVSFNMDTVGFGGKDTLSLYEHSGHSANVSLSGFFYLGGLVLGGRIFYARYYDFQHPSPLSELTADERHTTQLAYPELTLGMRSETFECDASYRFKTYYDDGRVRSLQWGQALLGLQNLAEAQVYWSAHVYTLVRGAGLSFDFEFFTSPHLGIWLDGYFERGVVYANDENSYSRKGFSLGVGWWASDRLELQFSGGVSTAQRESAGSTTLCLIVSNGYFLRRRDLPVWAPTPSDVTPRVRRGGFDRRQSVQSVLRGASRARGTVYRICTPPRRQSVQPAFAGLLPATLHAR